jgi:hypothetical protein
MYLVNSLKLIEKLKIWDAKNKVDTPFKLWPKQKEFLTTILTSKKVILLKKRQIGASQLTAADSLIQCMAQKNWTCLVLSITQEDADEYLKRAYDMYLTLPEDMRIACPVKKNNSLMEFPWGSRLLSLSASKGRSKTADRIIIDEAAWIKKLKSNVDLREVLLNVMPTLEKRSGQVIIISTANGLDVFYSKFLSGIRGVGGYVSFFFSCWDDPTFTKKDRELIIQDEGEDHANQEYPRTYQEAFISSGSPRFSISVLSEHYERIAPEIKIKGYMTDGGIVEDKKGTFSGFIKKEQYGQYLISADVAEGLENGDYSSAKVLCRRTGKQVSEWHGHIDYGDFGTQLVLLGKYYNNAILVVEANNHGNATIVQIKNVEKYPPYLIFASNYVVPKADDDFKRPNKRYGWMTTSISKGVIIDNLAYMILHKEIPFFIKSDLEELCSYVKASNGSTNAEFGCYDDRVMALAIGYYILKKYPYERVESWKNCDTCRYYDSDKKHCTEVDRVIKEPIYCRVYSELRIR